MSLPSAMSDPVSSPKGRDPERPPVALIAGPTAGGKSAVAVTLAQRTGGVVINADASQVYAGLSILTARPNATELASAPHRLFGHVDGAQDYNAACWAAEARAQIDDAHAAGRPAILVGGTGLYLDTLLYGIAPVPEIDPAIRAAIRAMPVGESQAALAREDPQAAARLAPADTSRIARALEVVRSTGIPLSIWQKRRRGGIAGAMTILGGVVVRERAELAERAAARLKAMLADGALDEVATLLARQLPADRPVLRALGVREIGAFLRGDVDLSEVETLILKTTLAYQKRQLTWARGRQARWARLAPDQDIGLEQLAAL